MQISTDKISEYFENQPVNKAWLFGSYADNTATENSDIDILVELDHSKPIGLRFVQMQIDLEKITGKHIDLISQKGLSPHIRPFVEKQKIIIYERR